MPGVLTGDRALAQAGIGDGTHYIAERVSGDRFEPVDGAVNTVACWGDTGTVRDDPERAAETADGTRATPERRGHHWGTVCPTDPDYRSALLDRLERIGAVGDVRLTTLGFPGERFCRCSRCERRFAASDYDDRAAWRTAVITSFVEAAAERVEESLVATLYPDPHPGHLRDRAGLDPAALSPHVDGFLVPLCGMGYETTYWVDSLARGFATRLDDLDVSYAVQLSADGTDVDRLVDLVGIVGRHADDVVIGTRRTDSGDVRAVVERLRDAAGQPGREPQRAAPNQTP